MAEYLERVKEAIANLELDEIGPLLREALDNGANAPAVLKAMSEGMVKVGELFEEGEYFLADLVLAGEAMKEGLKVLEPLLARESREEKGTVVLCTVKGDIHDIGKNLVGTMLTSAGFKVVDLGVDVHEDRVVEAVKANAARAVGLSVLLTTMVGSIGEVVEALRRSGLRNQVKIAVGGACTTQELVERMGADAMGKDAIEAVRIFDSWMGSTS